MANVKYAYFLPEGSGYLFVQPLGSGMEGWTSLVRSVADGKIYVRKQFRAQSATIGLNQHPSTQVGSEIASKEVSIYRPYPLIPTLIDWKEEIVRDPTTGNALPLTSTASIWQFCNGGDLEAFTSNFEASDTMIPELIIWRCFGQLLGTLDFLHRHCKPGVMHGDLGYGNIFLHWENNDSQMPDFYLGDFGSALITTPDSTISGTASHQIDADEFAMDVDSIGAVITEMITQDEDFVEEWENRLVDMQDTYSHYSNALFTCLGRLSGLKQAPRQGIDQYFTRLAFMASDVEARARTRASDPDLFVDVSFTKPRYSTDPIMFDSPHQLHTYHIKPPGHWRIAQIDPQSFRVLAVSKRIDEGHSAPQSTVVQQLVSHPISTMPNSAVELSANTDPASPAFSVDSDWNQEALYADCSGRLRIPLIDFDVTN